MRYGNLTEEVLNIRLNNEYWIEDAVYLNTTLKHELDQILDKYNETIEHVEYTCNIGTISYLVAYTSNYIIMLEQDDVGEQYLQVVPRYPTK